LQESEYRWKFAIEGSGDGLWDWNVADSVVFFSKRWKEMFGFAENEIGSSMDEWKNRIHSGDAADALVRLQDCLDAKAQTYVSEHRILCKDGSYKWILDRGMVVSRSEDGKALRLIGTVHDISERKQAEAALFQLNAELEQRVTQRTAELETAIYDLENFNYSASHDLRIPLRAVDGFSWLLLNEHSQQLDMEGRRLLTVVRDNTRKMSQFIDDMQSFSHTGRMPMAPAEIDMNDLVREVVEELKPVTAGRDIKLEIGSLPDVYADRPMLRWVMLNLLANAIKFTRPKAAALIEVGARSGDKETVFYVKDNGVGFDMKFADMLFGVFQRLHGVEEFEGAGIGLAIVKRIVTKLGGRVWAEGKVNEGATLFFSIPTRALPQKETA
jgi:PAS domain S-box-containing protein